MSFGCAVPVSRVSWPRLLEYAQRWGESATLQRLGYLLDLHDVSPEPAVRDQLGTLVNRESKIRLGDPKRWGSRGRFASEWGIVENVPRDVLIDPAEGARRPLQIPRPRG